jgi:hypothetical protein
MGPDVAMTCAFGRLTGLGVAWILWLLATSLAPSDCSRRVRAGRVEEALGAGDAVAGDFDGVAGLVLANRVVAPGIGVFGLVTASAEAIKRSQARYARKLGPERVDHREVSASGRGPEPLVIKQRRDGIGIGRDTLQVPGFDQRGYLFRAFRPPGHP